ncbi:Uncharacterized protein Y057_13426 [Fusarium fujikuroi]|nr:Uncharacterized protein Y057_13426 [Fusarium fujikuroi]
MKSFTLLVAFLASFAIASPWPSLVSRALDKRQAGRCGTGFGTVCGRSECCSSAGWCGTGYLYCSAPSCQIEYGPGCDANVRPSGPDTTNVARPKVGSIPYGQAIYRCNRNGDIALTYDDGPYTYTEDLLDLLQRYNAKATFYITGRNLGKGAINDPDTPWPGLIRRMVRDGHQIASHTWSHQRLTTLSRSKFWNQMIYNEIAFADILGYFPTYMRPPYSASNTTTDAWLNELGYHITYFNLDTEGYLHDSPNMISTSKQIWDNTVEGRSPATNKWLHIEHDPTDPCSFSTPASLSKDYASYSSQILSWYSKNEDEIKSALSECPELSQYATAVPVCATAALGGKGGGSEDATTTAEKPEKTSASSGDKTTAAAGEETSAGGEASTPTSSAAAVETNGAAREGGFIYAAAAVAGVVVAAL